MARFQVPTTPLLQPPKNQAQQERNDFSTAATIPNDHRTGTCNGNISVLDFATKISNKFDFRVFSHVLFLFAIPELHFTTFAIPELHFTTKMKRN